MLPRTSLANSMCRRQRDAPSTRSASTTDGGTCESDQPMTNAASGQVHNARPMNAMTRPAMIGAVVLALFIASALGRRSAQVGRRLWIARVGVTSLVLTTLAVYLAWLAPAMQTDLHAFWTALDAKNLDAALVAQASFDKYHPVASKFFSGMLVGVVILGLLTARGIGRGVPSQVHAGT